jgi:hypothetical protein
MSKTLRVISLKATEEDTRLLEALQKRWGLSVSDTLRMCMRDVVRRSHSRKRKTGQQDGLQEDDKQAA